MCVQRTVTQVQTLSWKWLFFLSLFVSCVPLTLALTEPSYDSTGNIQLWRCSKETCRVLDRYGRRFFPSGCRLLLFFASDSFLSDSTQKMHFGSMHEDDLGIPLFSGSTQRMNFWNTREWWSSKPTAGSKPAVPAVRHWCCATLV